MKITELYAVPLDRDQASIGISLSGKLEVEDNALTMRAGERIEVVGVDGLRLGIRTVVHENG